MKRIKVHAVASYHLASQCIYLEEMYSDVFRIEISTNSASLMPPRGIISSTKNHILCCQSLISYSFWSEGKSWISRGSSVAIKIQNVGFPFLSSCARSQNRASQGWFKNHLSSSQVCLAEKTKPRFNEIIFRIEINPAQGGCRPIRRGSCVVILLLVHCNAIDRYPGPGSIRSPA